MRTLGVIKTSNGLLNYIVQDDDDSYVAPVDYTAIDITGQTPIPMDGDFWDGNVFVTPDATKWTLIRMERDGLLINSDKEVLSDRWAAMDVATQTDWADYRQALRDLPTTYAGNPDGVVWPTLPA